jgi:hypothetical protein
MGEIKKNIQTPLVLLGKSITRASTRNQSHGHAEEEQEEENKTKTQKEEEEDGRCRYLSRPGLRLTFQSTSCVSCQFFVLVLFWVISLPVFLMNGNVSS